MGHAQRSTGSATRRVTCSPQILAELERYGIGVLQNVYEWGGSRYGNAPDAIAAAKRGSRSGATMGR